MKFQVTVARLQDIFDIPDSWSDQDYRALLDILEVEDIDEYAGSDLLDVLLMALQDMEPERAADVVLAYRLPERVSAGVRQNLVQDLLESSSPWKEAADVRLHARLFCVALLLYRALPKLFPKPDAMRLSLQLRCLNADAARYLGRPPEAAFVARLLADGMNENSILERLYDEQLFGHSFPEAKGVVWRAAWSDVTLTDPASAVLEVYSSDHWLEAMRDVRTFESNAYNDRVPAPEEEN